MPDSELGDEKGTPGDEEGGEGESHPSPRTPYLGPAFLAILGVLGKIGGIVAGVVSLLWFVYSQFSGVKELIQQNKDLAKEELQEVRDRVEELEWIMDRQNGIDASHKAGASPRRTLRAGREDLNYICEKLSGVYDFKNQYCDVEGRKVLYRFVAEPP